MNKFVVLVQIPKIPFWVAAVVGIDQLLLPASQNLKKVTDSRLAQARESLENSAKKISRQVKVAGLLVGLGLSLVAGLAGLLFAFSISRPILRLRDGLNQVGEGDFSVTVPASGAKEIAQLAQSFNHLGKNSQILWKNGTLSGTLSGAMLPRKWCANSWNPRTAWSWAEKLGKSPFS